LELGALLEGRREIGEAIEALGMVVAEEPTHEGAHVGIMRLHALSGRRRKALSQYEQLREALLKEFGTEPDAATTSLQQEIWAGTFPHSSDSPPAGLPERDEVARFAARAPRRRHNLPLRRTSFIGRKRECLEVKRHLAMTRLLTLTGTGGCGKTRLALEVARDLVGVYPDGVWLIELAPLSDEELVPKAVAQALEVPERPAQPLAETLAEILRGRELLLILDNCEHLLEATARLVDLLLDSCPHLRGLAPAAYDERPIGEALVASDRYGAYLADKGFTGLEWERHWMEIYGALVAATPYNDSRRAWPKADRRWASGKRQIIEGVIGQLKDFFCLERHRAKTLGGLLTRLAAKVAAYTCAQRINCSLGRPLRHLADLLV
jgi:hypothetical protein